MTELQTADIVIVGGGLTAQIMARALAHSGYEITCVTRPAPLASPAHSETRERDTRTTTIHAAGQRMLEALGIWALCTPKAEPITHIYVGADNVDHDWPLKFTSGTGTSSANMAGTNSFGDKAAISANPMAYTVDNQALIDALATHKAAKDITTIEADITSIDFSSETPKLQLQTGTILSCDLVIGCDGAGSFTRQEAGLKMWPRTTNQKAIVTRIRAEHHHKQAAYQRFLPEGPLAFMPLKDNMLALVWSLSEARADALLAADDADFEAALNRDFGPELGHLSLSQTDDNIRQIWPLRPTIIPQLTAKGLVLAGDAAHALHPLAGMGFNLALADMAVLADILHDSYHRGLPAGHAANLSYYTHRRRPEILAMSAVTEGLNRLFSYNALGHNHYGAAHLSRLAILGMRLIGKSRLNTQISKLAMGGILSSAKLLDGILPDKHQPK